MKTTYTHNALTEPASEVLVHLLDSGDRYFGKEELKNKLTHIEDFDSVWDELIEKEYVVKSIFTYMPRFGWKLKNPFRM